MGGINIYKEMQWKYMAGPGIEQGPLHHLSCALPMGYQGHLKRTMFTTGGTVYNISKPCMWVSKNLIYGYCKKNVPLSCFLHCPSSS